MTGCLLSRSRSLPTVSSNLVVEMVASTNVHTGICDSLVLTFFEKQRGPGKESEPWKARCDNTSA
jgi:hypothetical protein